MRSRQITIHDPRAALVFTHSPARRVLLQFARRARSIAEVARDLQMDIKRLHHTVQRLHKLGLLEVAQERPRAGRAIKLYRSVSESFFIPSAVAPMPFSRGLARELERALARDALLSVEGMVFSLDEQGRVSGRVVAKAQAAAVPLDSWRILRLSPQRASLLKREVLALLDRFQDDADTGGQVYLIHAGMARRPEHCGATDNAALPVQ